MARSPAHSQTRTWVLGETWTEPDTYVMPLTSGSNGQTKPPGSGDTEQVSRGWWLSQGAVSNGRKGTQGLGGLFYNPSLGHIYGA